MKISIASEIKEKCPDVSLGILKYSAQVKESQAELQQLMQSTLRKLEKQYILSDIAGLPHIQATRKAYKALGKSPYQYRNASEAMLRRIVKGNGLYLINNVVEVNNFISIISGYSIGSFLSDRLSGAIELRRAPDGEKYKGIGKDLINIEHLPTLYDDEGAFGNPTSDSQRAMIQIGEHKILSVIYSFDGGKDLQNWIQQYIDLLGRYCLAPNIQTDIVH